MLMNKNIIWAMEMGEVGRSQQYKYQRKTGDGYSFT
jgi:hypothetical protein